MKRLLTIALLFLYFLFGCDNNIGKTNNIDKSLIGQAERLPSPYSDKILYRYFIESSMSLGSGFTAIKILPSDKKCNYTDDDFLRFGNDNPFFIKWKSKDTLTVKCLKDGGQLADNQPFIKEIKKWKDWTFEVEYYSMYSASAEIIYPFDSYSFKDNFITFKSKKNTITFRNDEVQISLDTNNIFLTQFKIDTLNSKLGLAFSHYDFKHNYNKNAFVKQQAFIKETP